MRLGLAEYADDEPVPSYHDYRFPPEIISHAVWLYHRFCLTFRVSDLDSWIGKLRAEQVTFLGPAQRLGDFSAVMIEGPSREATELVEAK